MFARKLMIALSAATMTVAAFAQSDATVNTAKLQPAGAVPTQQAVPGKTRAQVQAELVQARRDGTLALNQGEGSYGAMPFTASRSRSDVRDEIVAARNNGTMIQYRDGADYPARGKPVSHLTREQKRADDQTASNSLGGYVGGNMKMYQGH
jgi:hypothetical protein